MSVTRRAVQIGGFAAGAFGAFATCAPDTKVGHAIRRTANQLARDIRYAGASAPGLAYRLAGRHPDPNVSDDVLADRVRSSLGPVERRLDIPHLHFMVEDHVVLLHGDVPDHDAAASIQRAVFRVSGVRGVKSHLHIGLVPGDTRPSEAEKHHEQAQVVPEHHFEVTRSAMAESAR